MCDKFDKLCNNFLDQIGCVKRSVQGCNPDLPNWSGTCKCLGEPVYQDKGSRVSKELLDNRIKGDVGWMLEPWESGPPYNFDLSCECVYSSLRFLSLISVIFVVQGICERALYRIGCSDADHTIEVGSRDGNVPYTCACGKYTDASSRVQELITDKLNEAELMETPVFEDPFTFSLQLSMAFVMVVGKLGLVASALYLPPIIGFLLAGMGMQNIVSTGLIKGAGGNGPHPTPFGEMRIFALVIVLMRAGISLKPKTISKEGLIAILLCFLPYVLEFVVELVVGMQVLGWNAKDAGLLASILAALSPALVIAGMINMVEHKLGYTPRLVLSSAPVEVVLAIILYGIFANLEETSNNPIYPWVTANPLWLNIVLIPITILYSAVVGFITGLINVKYFEFRHKINGNRNFEVLSRICPENTAEYLFVCIVSAYTLYAICQAQYLNYTSGVLAVYVQMLTVSEWAEPTIVYNLKEGLSGLWVFIEVVLFTSVGINLSFVNETGPLQSQRGMGNKDVANLIKILFLGALGRSAGVFICNLASSYWLLPHRRDMKYMLAWWFSTWLFQLPKATVQATLGGLPFSQHVIPGADGLTKGAYILHATAFSVLLMAPIGVFLTAVIGHPIARWLKSVDDANGVVDPHDKPAEVTDKTSAEFELVKSNEDNDSNNDIDSNPKDLVITNHPEDLEENKNIFSDEKQNNEEVTDGGDGTHHHHRKHSTSDLEDVEFETIVVRKDHSRHSRIESRLNSITETEHQQL
jgi:hypothetical protein